MIEISFIDRIVEISFIDQTYINTILVGFLLVDELGVTLLN